MEGDVDDVGSEDVAELVAEPLDQRVQIQLVGECLTDAVDDRELRRALPCLLEEAGVLESDAQAAGDRCQQAHVRVAERVFAIEVVE